MTKRLLPLCVFVLTVSYMRNTNNVLYSPEAGITILFPRDDTDDTETHW